MAAVVAVVNVPNAVIVVVRVFAHLMANVVIGVFGLHVQAVAAAVAVVVVTGVIVAAPSVFNAVVVVVAPIFS